MNLKEYFELSKKELNGIIILIVLLILATFTPEVYSYLNPPASNYYDPQFQKEVNEFLASVEEEETHYSDKGHPLAEPKKRVVKYFSFNPNNLTKTQWFQLGLSARQIRVIKNFEAKGGRFYKKEDLKKIYSISPADYSRLEPYIIIPDAGYSRTAYKKYEKKVFEKEITLVDINKADSSELESLRGIGPAFASRIIKYRNRLGGFWRKEQLLEVYGLDSLKYRAFENRIIIGTDNVSKLNVNSASFSDLRKYPYLSYKQINAILQYRNQHGNYGSLADLRKVLILNDEVLAKIAPYLTF